MSQRKLFIFFSILIIVNLLTWQIWAGNKLILVLFNTSFWLMLGLAWYGKPSYVYTFFSLFLFLGIWAKWLWHAITDTISPIQSWYEFGYKFTFIEPIGQFNGTLGAWGQVMIVASVGAVAVFFAKLLQLALSANQTYNPTKSNSPPYFYVKHRAKHWSTLITFMLILNIWNQLASFYQIGINSSIHLPFHLNVMVSWAINWGCSFMFALLAFWEMQTTTKTRALVLCALLFVAMITSISTLSRSCYILQGFAFCLAWLLLDENKSIKKWGGVSILFVLGFALSLGSVQTLRADKYAEPSNISAVLNRANIFKLPQLISSANAATIEEIKKPKLQDSEVMSVNSSAYNKIATSYKNRLQSFKQIPSLFLNRWVGLEGLMATTAYPSKSFELFKLALKDNPNSGVDSLFQRISNAQYSKSDKYTFMTLAGPIALLYMSNSLILVGLGMLVITFLMLLIEVRVNHAVSNPYVTSLAAVAMAYNVTQMTFPYLTLVFFIQLFLTLVAIYWIYAYSRTTKRQNC